MAETRRVDAVARIAHLLQGLLKHPYAVSQATRPAIGALMKGKLGSGRSRFYSLYLAAAFGAFDTGKSCPWHPVPRPKTELLLTFHWQLSRWRAGFE